MSVKHDSLLNAEGRCGTSPPWAPLSLVFLNPKPDTEIKMSLTPRYIFMCALLFGTGFFFRPEKPWKMTLGLSCGKEEIFQPWTGLRYHSLRTVWEYNNSPSYHTKKGKQKCFADLGKTSSNEDESPGEDKPAEIAGQPVNPACHPPSLVLTQSPNFTLLSSPMPWATEKNPWKTSASDWGREHEAIIALQ